MKHSILCVDDEVDNVDALERLFRRKYRVLKATSGEEALRLLAVNPVAVIISDQRMPQMSGVELLAASIKTHPKAIRILLTGYTDVDSVIAAINSGHIYRYVTKPWDPVDLTNAVDKAVERYDIGEELIEKNHALQIALEELQTLDQAKNQFMILVNHELKTPLTAMLNFTDLLNETKLDTDQKHYLSRVKTAAMRLQEMINDALEFVLAETAQMKIEPKLLPAKKFFTEASLPELVKELAASRQVSFAFAIENGSFLGDEKAIRNVFRRLTHNAAKFADKGSVIEITGQIKEHIPENEPSGAEAVTSSAKKKAGKKTASRDRYEVTIKNAGGPIDKDRIAQIIKPFTLNENVMNHSVGTGMGLSICQAILKLQDSALRIVSKGREVKSGFSLPSK